MKRQSLSRNPREPAVRTPPAFTDLPSTLQSVPLMVLTAVLLPSSTNCIKKISTDMCIVFLKRHWGGGNEKSCLVKHNKSISHAFLNCNKWHYSGRRKPLTAGQALRLSPFFLLKSYQFRAVLCIAL